MSVQGDFISTYTIPSGSSWRFGEGVPSPRPKEDQWWGEGETVAEEAQRLTTGERNQTYGHPLDDYTRTAKLWTALLAHKLKGGEEISYADAIRCMCAVKLSRDVHHQKRDNRVDMAGYAQCLQFADDEQARRGE